jgi:UDP-GlcNAc:undecaprenyl-phosphate GlcNAc-1-phosphate transferase
MTENDPMAIHVAIVFCSATLLGLIGTLAMRRISPRLGLTDRPDGRRKLHRAAMPLGGGAAVFVATVTVLAALYVIPNPWREALCRNSSNAVALLQAALVIVLVGLVDDRRQLRGRHKLAGQIIAISILVFNGLIIQRMSLFGHQLDLGLLAIPFTYFWLLGAINSVNLLDGLDGLATLLGIILVATFAVLASMTGRSDVMIIAVAFAGSLCGFLRFNFPPATIFLGDAGSMLIGLVVGTLAMQGSLKGPGTVLLAAPLAIWTLPILDSAAAILRRKLTGRSIYSTDRGHLHHRLMEHLASHRKVLVAVAICSTATSAAALFSVFLKNDLIALFVSCSVIFILVTTGLFGGAEFALLRNRLQRIVRAMMPEQPGTPAEAACTAVRLQGSRHWDVLWEALTESVEKFHATRLHLDLDLPMIQESYDATWEKPGGCDHEVSWQMEIPLVAGFTRVGSLSVTGQRNGVAMCHYIEPLLEVVESIESQLRGLVEASRAPAEQRPPQAWLACGYGEVAASREEFAS